MSNRIQTAYIAIGFSNRKTADQELNTVKDILQAYHISPLVFVDQYLFGPEQEKEMMQCAMREIDNCDILIAETSVKAIGIGVEAGYAKAKGKPLIYVRRSNTDHSTTVAGISDYQLVYADTRDLADQLVVILNQLQSDKGQPPGPIPPTPNVSM